MRNIFCRFLGHKYYKTKYQCTFSETNAVKGNKCFRCNLFINLREHNMKEVKRIQDTKEYDIASERLKEFNSEKEHKSISWEDYQKKVNTKTEGSWAEFRMDAHLKGLSKSKNAKECGDLTVVPLGYVSDIVVEMAKSKLTSLLSQIISEVEGLKQYEYKSGGGIDKSKEHEGIWNDAVTKALEIINNHRS